MQEYSEVLPVSQWNASFRETQVCGSTQILRIIHSFNACYPVMNACFARVSAGGENVMLENVGSVIVEAVAALVLTFLQALLTVVFDLILGIE